MVVPSRSRIEQMSILGIRSFGERKPEKITFGTPLTLIVGFNGSGKTTIIECLKYATTGLLPPNTKQNGAFIHDPKLAGEKEVLGQVRLKFKNASGATMVATRSLSVNLIRGGKRQMKTLDCNLTVQNGTERTSVSSRVADLDRLVPQFLGVSQAVLDNVIFCHQDESLWPMSEPSILKKKFDEIFEALKYTKAMENLKILKKDKVADLKGLLAQEAGDKFIKDKGEQCKNKTYEIQGQIDEMGEKINSLEAEMSTIREASTEKTRQANEAQGIVNRLEADKTQANYLRENLDDLKRRMEEMDESDETLQSTLDRYEELLEQYKRESENFKGEYYELDQAEKATREKLSKKTIELGQLQAEKKSYEGKIQERLRLVKEAANRHGMREYDGDLDDAQVEEFVDRVRKLSRNKDLELERIHKETEDELRDAQTTIDELNNRRSNLTSTRVTAKQTIETSAKTSRNLQQKVDLKKVDEGQLAALEVSLNGVRDRLQKATAEFEAADYDKNLRIHTTKLKELEIESEKWSSELAQSVKLATDNAKLEHTKDLLTTSKNSLETMKVTHGDKLASVIGADWRVETLQQEFKAVLNQKTEALKDAKAQQEQTSRDLSAANFKLKSHRDDLKAKKEKLKTSLNAVLNSAPDPLSSIDDYEMTLDQLETDRDTLRSDLDNFRHLIDYYTGCLTTIEKHDKCKLCDRKFTDTPSRTSAVDKLRKQIAKNSREAIEQELQVIEEDLKAVKSVRSDYDICKLLSGSEIPVLEKNVKEAENEREALLRVLERHDSLVSQEGSNKTEVEALAQTVAKISQYSSEILQHESDLTNLSSQQKFSGSSLSGDEIKEKVDECRERMRTVTTKRDKLASEKDHANTVTNDLRMDEQRASSELKEARRELEEKEGLLSRIEELRQTTLQQRESIKHADLDLQALSPLLARANAQKDDIQRAGRAKESEIQADKNKLTNTTDKFKMLEGEINKYLEDGVANKLVACQQSIKTLQQEQTRIESERSAAAAKTNEVRQKIEDSDYRKRNINENIEYRKKIRGLKEIESRIEELEVRNVTDDWTRLDREATKLRERHAKLDAERISTAGHMRGLDNQLNDLLKEWDVDYKNAATKYRETHIRVETTKAAVDDIQQYTAALDQAIMKYHSLKMEEINRIAGELWQSTYQGTDVDTIMIRSDPEDEKSKKSFHYRVVMVKEDAEMDMRGRCSAGQRVLASIIIRLALAECFGVNCGIIALDEPTTNLDADNIRALAVALNAIIKTRQQQANFQLLVITHDEEFLKAMKCSEFCDSYYHVNRNEHQKSIIKSEDITTL